MTDNIAISLRDVHKVYRLYGRPLDQLWDAVGLSRLLRPTGRRQEFHALRGVSLDVPRGARIGLVGRNGAGKTTLLKLLTRNYRPSKGTVQVNGQVVALIEIGVGFHPEFTGIENIRASIAYNGLSDDEVEAAIRDVTEFCELGDFLHQPLKTYSLGMKSRLYFACATAVKPDILVIDEVLGAGDAYFAVRSAERMKILTQNGCTLLLVSHSIQQIVQFCDEAIWLEAGEVIKQGPVLEVVKSYEEFVRELDEQHLKRTPGEPSVLTNQWLHRHLLGKVLAGGGAAESGQEAGGLAVVAMAPAIEGAGWRDERLTAGGGGEQLGLGRSAAVGNGNGGIVAGVADDCLAGSATGLSAGGDRGASVQIGSAAGCEGGAADGVGYQHGEIVADGGVSRWPAAPGPKIVGVEIHDCQGPTGQLVTGEVMEVHLRVRTEVAGEYCCRYSLLFFTQDVRWACRFHSPAHSFVSQAGQEHRIALRLERLQLSNGEYLMSAGIFGDSTLDRVGDAIRYDILSLSYRFRVVDRIRTEQAIFHHPCEWRFEVGQAGMAGSVHRVECGLA
jgi:lipopolysaccharide transport system ATP-binding protein